MRCSLHQTQCDLASQSVAARVTDAGHLAAGLTVFTPILNSYFHFQCTERSLRDGMLGCFRCLEAPEEQPEGEKDDLEHCDGKGKDSAPP
jgi:hypothetical protein